MIGSELRRFKTEKKYFGFDFETENINLHYNLPWQLSFAVFDLKTIHNQEVFYIKWDDLNISDGAAKITRFDRSFYDRYAKDPKEILNIFEQHIFNPEYDIVFQNGLLFDIYIHQNWRRKLGLEPNFEYLNRCIDLISLTKAIQKGWTPDLENFVSWQYKAMHHLEKGLKSSLTWVGQHLNIDHDYNTLHDAKSDVELMIKIFRKQIVSIDV